MKNVSKTKQFLFTVVSWVIILFLVNFACGLVVQNRYIAVDAINKKNAQSTWGYFTPDQDKIVLFPGLKPYKVKINSLGFRNVGLPEGFTLKDAQGKYRVLCMGDSLTFGLFVDDEDTFPYQLQQMIDQDNKNAVVFNAGVESASIPDYLYYLKKKGLKLKPDLVTLNFCTNDLFEQDREKRLYDQMRDENVASFFKTFKLAKFMRIFRKFELARRYRRSVGKIKDERVKRALLEESKDIEDALYVAAFHAKEAVTDPYHPDLKERWKRYFDTLDEVVNLLRKEKIDFIYIIYPDVYTVFSKGKANYQEIVIDHLQKKGVEYIDLRPIFEREKDKVFEIYNNLPRDFHLSHYGNKILAEEFYKQIKNKID